MPAVVGEKAPGFTLPTDRPENKVSLGDYTREGPVAHTEFSLLADFDKQSIEDYGVVQADGFPERAYFIIDCEGVEFSARDQPEVEAVLEVLDRAL